MDMPSLHQFMSSLKGMALQPKVRLMESTQLEWTVTMCLQCTMPQNMLEIFV